MNRAERLSRFRALLGSLTEGGAVRRWEVFGRFCEAAYCSVAKPCQREDRAEKLEERYMKIVASFGKEHPKDEMHCMSEMMAVAVQSVAEDRCDFLGEVYELEGFCDEKFGAQFFTPEPVAEAMAAVMMAVPPNPEPPVTTLMEPAGGSGRMVLAAVREFEREGRGASAGMWVDAADLDVVCQQMTYLQMAAMGVPGVVRHMNSLSQETYDWAVTPSGARLLNESEWLRNHLSGKGDDEPPMPRPEPSQSSLF